VNWEMVVGLETHVELSTKTKIFCACPTHFGGAPNSHCCPICTGQPGSLPLLNKSVVRYAATAGLALNCRVNNYSIMARKHYVYPDLPKAYQISQFDKPLCDVGTVELSGGRSIRITRIHIEEDAGKLIHTGDAVLIDYNRGGVPLIEIVSEPDFRSSAEAVEYLEKLQAILRAVGVSDCRMQEGSLRCDVNISLRPEGSETFGIRTEIKNLNSFTSVAAAIEYEYKRQKKLLDNGGVIVQETRGWNADTCETVSQRGKEDANDYRYFPEPDIGDIYISDAEIQQLRSMLPELPDEKLERYVNELGISRADAKLLTKYGKLSEYLEAACEESFLNGENIRENSGMAKTVASFMVMQMFAMITTEVERENWSPKTSASQLGPLVWLLESGKLSRNIAKRVFAQMLETGSDAKEFITDDDISGFSGEALKKLCYEAIIQNPKPAADYREGKEKAIKSLVGAVMRDSKGRADAIEAERVLKEQLKL
jgi:aspartyl-tRNA(Asn)/glutamyl-tRNA(Gln) amidotransferase subunit B